MESDRKISMSVAGRIVQSIKAAEFMQAKDAELRAAGYVEIMPGEWMAPGSEHFLDGSCWCGPTIEGNVVKHKGI